ncbi:Ribosome-binding factor A [Mycoplasmopsis agalactiae]|uniref:Ribosome-binding factor A n=1 Tax=Mycoplasmopsis agalactiae (strain NCTC 10123 / CIP 59.7 / PG2) TaxID=347257 RepID=RBFA_MYCAP|nr:30S ribosome-binding factor RbfA [Mycoplasmopsis agalactiae]A5IZH0.1 RecName: Full=Ribosome-binding factor A [Mycoplasmopsis agalactiae PG2]MCE6057449.1 30S ribosome-binding factor RbfA [Mycoplasmopsis agalactiae]MCE6079225.1 30S ribosome-binding factor RbfA [Mycoplasmopsis agalactiae]MCE6095618.1 30S ribosome-binding factor RbfA [Mycoplasmopsis agalactiae]MCE6114864.1 30S ribosome-binding factor RbfA [Mycoplasmopsis agalactiae]NLS34618.1 30S ribosome-binding factor RbfA [Mycoplasmopsis ag
MKKSISVLRKESQIKNFISTIITNELTNANIYNPTVTDVVLSTDLGHVKVFLAFSSKENDGLDAVKNASGYIRKRLSKTLNWRKVPELHFYIDEVEKKAFEIDQILNSLKNEE